VRGELRQVYGLGDGVSLPRRDVHHPLPGSPPDVTEPAQGYAQPQDQAAAMANPAPEDIGPLDVKSTARERADVYMRTTFPESEAARRIGFTPAMAEKLGPDGKFPMPRKAGERARLDRLVPHNVRRAYNNNFTAWVARWKDLLPQRRNDEHDISPQRQLLCEPMAEENEQAEYEELRAQNSLPMRQAQQSQAYIDDLQNQLAQLQEQAEQADNSPYRAEEADKDGHPGSDLYKLDVPDSSKDHTHQSGPQRDCLPELPAKFSDLPDSLDYPDWSEERGSMRKKAPRKTLSR
jgi:hypothetical protein